MNNINEEIKKLTIDLEYDPNKFNFDNILTNITDLDSEKKRFLSELGLYQMFNNADQRTMQIMTTIIEELTGLELNNNIDLTKYISKTFQDEDRFGNFIEKLISIEQLYN